MYSNSWINGPTLQTVKKGKTLLLGAKTDEKNKKIAWKSLNENVAVIDENGNITAKNIGVTVIMAIADNDDFDNIVIRVKS